MKKNILLILVVFLFNSVYSQTAFIPEPSLKVISDYENLLSNQEKELLAADIKGEYNANSNQLMVLMIPTVYLGQLTIEDYAQKLFDKWQPGQKGLNNGVLLIVCGSKTDSVGRKVRIHTGLGVEGVLPDLLCSRIEKEMIQPELKRGNYFLALKKGCASVLNLISTENVGKVPTNKIQVLKNQNLVYDYARIFSEAEKKSLEEKLNGYFNLNHAVIKTNYAYDTDINYAFITRRGSFDTTFLDISFNPGYYMDEKSSSLKFDNERRSYLVSYFGKPGEFKYDSLKAMDAISDSFTKILNTAGVYKASLAFINQAKKAYHARLMVAARYFIYMLAASGVVFLMALFCKNKKEGVKGNGPLILKLFFGIVLNLIMLYSALSLVTLEMLYYSELDDYIALRLWQLLLIMLVLAASHVFNVFYIYKLNKSYFNSNLFSWLSILEGLNFLSSSKPSSKSSRSSNSGSGSSSNSGYYGGGGKSGGGGASSDW